MPVTIDHTAYPYIIDLIIEHAPLASIRRLGATSRAFRSRLQLHHAVLKLQPGAKRVELVHSDRWGDDGSPYPPLILTTPGGRALPLTPGKVRVLDHVVRERPGPLLSNAFTSIDTLRRMNGAYDIAGPTIFYPTRIVVDFVHVREQSPSYSGLMSNGSRDKINIVVPLGATKYVVHLKLSHSVSSSATPMITVEIDNEYAALGHLVFALSVPSNNDLFSWGFLHSAICSATRFWTGDGPSLSITVVGLERVNDPPTADQLWAQLARYVSVWKAQRAPIWWGDKTRKEEVRRAIRLVTFEEWWVELGARKEVEGVWVDWKESGWSSIRSGKR
ncbi:uncharacterized protein LOC62_04G005344 [Vanrija pseudolonga]|uniref:Uncharacterized protein n=1 Tax=Vanrija pseudolonga TaxID=143232 RepID=A0AAF0YCA3_9TREE|nr:hypothetical protein LOC62_04G005344 [Vanrija pseudolonga]